MASPSSSTGSFKPFPPPRTSLWEACGEGICTSKSSDEAPIDVGRSQETSQLCDVLEMSCFSYYFVYEASITNLPGLMACPRYLIELWKNSHLQYFREIPSSPRRVRKP